MKWRCSWHNSWNVNSRNTLDLLTARNIYLRSSNICRVTLLHFCRAHLLPAMKQRGGRWELVGGNGRRCGVRTWLEFHYDRCVLPSRRRALQQVPLSARIRRRGRGAHGSLLTTHIHTGGESGANQVEGSLDGQDSTDSDVASITGQWSRIQPHTAGERNLRWSVSASFFNIC